MQVQDQTQQEGLPAGVSAVGTAAERLADHVSGLRFEDLPDDAVTKVKELLLHHLGLAFRGHADRTGQQVLQAARYLSGPAGSCTVIGERQPATVLDAVLANSFLMHHLGMDDFVMPPGIHAGILTHPTGLAVGELSHSSGRDYITAVVAGYDVIITLARVMFPWNLPLPRQPFMLYGPFASAAVAARLLGLARTETAHALALAAHGGMGLIEGGVFLPIQPQVARNGVMAAVLAQSGMTEVPTTIEGKGGLYSSYLAQVPDGLETTLQALGDEFEIMNVRTKRYSSSGLNIVPMELMLQLVKAHALRAENVAHIDVILPDEREQREAYRESLARNHAGGSLRFLVAGVVSTGTVDPEGFTRDRDQRLDAALENVHLRFEPGRPSRFCRIEVKTTRDERFVAEGEDHAFPPIDWDSWLAEGGRQIFSALQLERLLELVQGLEHVDDLREVTRCLVPEGR
jgi:2-methylcitrate dehydratase PrpD